MSGAVSMHILKVHCRHCGEEIPVEMPEGAAMKFAEAIAYVEKRSEELHTCAAQPREGVTS